LAEKSVRPHLKNEALDNIGAGLSFACAIHCVATPFILAVLPFAGVALVLSHEFELIFILLSLLLALISLSLGYRLHQNRSVFLILAVGVIFFALGLFFISEDHHSAVLALGAVCLVIAHLVNKRLYRFRISSR